MRNLQSKFYPIVFATVSLFIFFLSNTSNADPLKIYSGLRNRDFIKSGFHERLYGVWIFEMDTEQLIISGLEYNGWSGRVFGEYHYPHYRWKIWEKRFEINNIEKIISALNKATKWSEIANEEDVINFKKDLINLGQGLSIYFNVSETGMCSVVFRNNKWIFRDKIRDGGYVDRFIELWVNFDESDSSQDTITDMLDSLKNYKERHQKYVEEEAKNRILQLQQVDKEKKEKERINQLFQ